MNNLQFYSCARSQHAHAIRVNWLNIITIWNNIASSKGSSMGSSIGSNIMSSIGSGIDFTAEFRGQPLVFYNYNSH